MLPRKKGMNTFAPRSAARSFVGLVLFAGLLSASGCGQDEKIQMPDNPTPPPGPNAVLKPLDGGESSP
jgi:hypothetical protein